MRMRPEDARSWTVSGGMCAELFAVQAAHALSTDRRLGRAARVARP